MSSSPCSSSSPSSQNSVTTARPSAEGNFADLKLDAYLMNALKASKKDQRFIIKTEAGIIGGLLRGAEGVSAGGELASPSTTFPQLNSYYRMLVHRVARYYGLEHMTDAESRSVTVWCAPPGHERPLLKLADLAEPEERAPREQRRSEKCSSTPSFTIMRRSTSAGAGVGVGVGEAGASDPSKKSAVPAKSLEEREREYEAVRARIFENFDENDPVEEGDFSPETAPIAAAIGATEEVISFTGWGNVDAIEPFIPFSLQLEDAAAPSLPLCSSVMAVVASLGIEAEIEIERGRVASLGEVWIPRHIFVATGLPVDDAGAKSLRPRLKRLSCKLVRRAGAAVGLILFSYLTGDSPEALSALLGVACQHWLPSYLPEPPV